MPYAKSVSPFQGQQPKALVQGSEFKAQSSEFKTPSSSIRNCFQDNGFSPLHRWRVLLEFLL